MQKITTHLWFDKEAKEAASFYTSVFPNARILSTTTLEGTPSGAVDIVVIDLDGQEFTLLSAGPYFKINPSVSFFLNFDPSRDPQARENLDTMWEQLSQGGKVLMSKQEYPFSKQYGWIQDKFGVSWQLILTAPVGEPRPFIVPSLLFVGPVCGKAEEATKFYQTIFKHSKQGTVARYPAGMEPDLEGSIMFTDFMIENQWFGAMDSAHTHAFSFNEAVSFIVHCNDQAEVDYFWEKLSADPKAEQCGWLKDRYGLSWQIVPTDMEVMMKNGTKEQMARVTEAFLKMKKFDIATLRKAYDQP